MGRLVKNLGSRRLSNGSQKLTTLAALCRQKSTETEGIGRQAAGDQCCEECRRSRDGNDWYVVPNGERDEPKTRIRNTGHAGVGYECDTRALLKFNHQFGEPASSHYVRDS